VSSTKTSLPSVNLNLNLNLNFNNIPRLVLPSIACPDSSCTVHLIALIACLIFSTVVARERPLLQSDIGSVLPDSAPFVLRSLFSVSQDEIRFKTPQTQEHPPTRPLAMARKSMKREQQTSLSSQDHLVSSGDTIAMNIDVEMPNGIADGRHRANGTKNPCREC
jgi:hypothetical protein